MTLTPKQIEESLSELHLTVWIGYNKEHNGYLLPCCAEGCTRHKPRNVDKYIQADWPNTFSGRTFCFPINNKPRTAIYAPSKIYSSRSIGALRHVKDVMRTNDSDPERYTQTIQNTTIKSFNSLCHLNLVQLEGTQRHMKTTSDLNKKRRRDHNAWELKSFHKQQHKRPLP